ncbi:MAG: cation:proton antiporter [Verrucomicrobia bacterium]|nr:cation:proton antiporter [Verrucomicrobiota bacterium]
MAGIDLIQDFAILLLAAGLAGTLCKRVGLSVIVGYLIAGIIIGPHTPPFSLIVDEARIMALSQVGLVFLLFSIGLGLSVGKITRMGAGPLVATGLGAFFVLNLTELLAFAVGWTPLQAMFVAAMLMVSSSAVIAKIVIEQGLAHERSSQLALAVTVLEDVVAVAMLTILGSQAQAGAAGASVGRLLGGLSAFVVLLVGTGLLLVPRLLRRLEARADPEMQTVIVAGVLFLLALTAAKAGYSIALGAFLFGAVVAEIPQRLGIEKTFAGLRDLFSSVFFVAIGMMIDLQLLADVWPTILGLTALALVGRPIACSAALILVGTGPREARRASLLLTPLGEFSFIIAQLGISTAILPPSFYPIAVGASILTVLATPLMNRHRDAILRAADRLEPRWLRQTLEAYHGWTTLETCSKTTSTRRIAERPQPLEDVAWTRAHRFELEVGRHPRDVVTNPDSAKTPRIHASPPEFQNRGPREPKGAAIPGQQEFIGVCAQKRQRFGAVGGADAVGHVAFPPTIRGVRNSRNALGFFLGNVHFVSLVPLLERPALLPIAGPGGAPS